MLRFDQLAADTQHRHGGIHTAGGPCGNNRIFLCTPLDPIDWLSLIDNVWTSGG
jgi:hypothetical protein